MDKAEVLTIYLPRPDIDEKIVQSGKTMLVNQIQTAVPPRSVPAPAEKLEQAFLEEMLKYCGPKTATGAFGGGAGEEQFGSFLTQEYAAVLAAQIDLGLAKGMEQP